MTLYKTFIEKYKSFKNYLFGNFFVEENEKIKEEIKQREQKLESLAKTLSEQEEALEKMGFDYRKLNYVEPINLLKEEPKI